MLFFAQFRISLRYFAFCFAVLARKSPLQSSGPERVKKVFLTRSQTENATLVFRRSKLRILRPAASGRPHPLRCCSSPNRNRFAGFLFGWAWKRLASCCAHNLCAAGTQIPHLQDVKCFARCRSVKKRRQWRLFSVRPQRLCRKGETCGAHCCARRNSTSFLTD